MTKKTLTDSCPICCKEIVVQRVVEYHNSEGFRGYSFALRCPCGARTIIDGCKEDEIPESMKKDAENRRRRQKVREKIGFDSRSLNRSVQKSSLLKAVLIEPKRTSAECWLVAESDQEWHLYYSEDTMEYQLIVGGLQYASALLSDLAVVIPCN